MRFAVPALRAILSAKAAGAKAAGASDRNAAGQVQDVNASGSPRQPPGRAGRNLAWLALPGLLPGLLTGLLSALPGGARAQTAHTLYTSLTLYTHTDLGDYGVCINKGRP